MLTASPIIGRRPELERLEAALAQAEAGRPAVAAVLGPGGIGKSRVLAELTGRADARGHLTLAGAGAEYEQDLPFWVFVDALDAFVAGLDPRRFDRLDPTVRAELAQVLPSLAGAADGPVAALHERYRVHRAMRGLLEQLAATTPLVLVLDDLHWADQSSIDLLVALLHRPPDAGVLLVAGARPRQLAPRLATALDRAQRTGTLTRVELEPLTREEARELVGDGADALYEESGGNPFFLEQLARTTVVAAVPGDGLRIGGADVPPMVASALAEELSLLSESARRVLDGAAVAGDPFDVDLAGAAAAMDGGEVLAGLDELTGLDLVRPGETPRHFRFRHPILRRAVYEAMPGGRRIAAHERAASALAALGAPATARAHHVERAARQGDLEAVAVLREAAESSASRAPATSARWYAAALRLLPAGARPHERVELLLPMARELSASGQFAAGHERLLEALEVVPDDASALRTQVATLCGRVEHLLGRHDVAHDRLVAALEALPGEASPEGVSLLVELTMDRGHRMAYGEMLPWAERAVRAARRVDDPALSATALGVRARAASAYGATRDAVAAHAEAAARIDAMADRELARRLDGLAHLAGAELYLHRFTEARAHAERVLAIGRTTGRAFEFPQVFAIVGISGFFTGDLVGVVDAIEAGIESARLSGSTQALGWALYARSRVALAAGEVDVALSTAQESFDVTYDGRPNHRASLPATTLAEAHLHLGKPDRAVRLLEENAGGPEVALVEGSFRALFLEVLARARLALGEVDAADRAARVAAGSAEAVRLPLAQAWADRAEAAVALERGDAARAAELAGRAVRAATAATAPVEAAIARSLAGQALAAAGRRDEAVEALERSAGALDALGARRHRDAAERELRRLGRRIHRRSQPTAATGTGVDALTKRELEIARRIVDRQTNRQIAQELFLSPKTVETHVRNIFGKLGADSRVEVARIVEQADRRP
jgi:DNA-binding NarL/FixJ family response regulator